MPAINPGKWPPDKIKALRRRFQLSLVQLEILTGITGARFSEWENGKRKPSTLTRWALDAVAERLAREYKHL